MKTIWKKHTQYLYIITLIKMQFRISFYTKSQLQRDILALSVIMSQIRLMPSTSFAYSNKNLQTSRNL